MRLKIILIITFFLKFGYSFGQKEPENSYYISQSKLFFITWYNNQVLNKSNNIYDTDKSSGRNNFIDDEFILSSEVLKNYFKDVRIFSVKMGLLKNSPILYVVMSKISGRPFLIKNETDFNTLLKNASEALTNFDKSILYLILTNNFGEGAYLIYNNTHKLKNSSSKLLFNEELEGVFYNDSIAMLPQKFYKNQIGEKEIIGYKYTNEDNSIEQFIFNYDDSGTLESVNKKKYKNQACPGIPFSKFEKINIDSKKDGRSN